MPPNEDTDDQTTPTDGPGRDSAARIFGAARDEQKQLADPLGCDIKVVNRVVNGRTSVAAEMALKLGATFRTAPEFWLNAQKAVDLYRASTRVTRLPRPLLKAS